MIYEGHLYPTTATAIPPAAYSAKKPKRRRYFKPDADGSYDIDARDIGVALSIHAERIDGKLLIWAQD